MLFLQYRSKLNWI